jgi:hypothetical protein
MNRLLPAVLLFLCQGCGLVVWPYSTAYPDPIKRVRIEDAQTGSPIRDAKVSYRILPCDYDSGGIGYTTDRWPAVAGEEGRRGIKESVRLNDDPSTLTYEPVNSTGELSIAATTKWGLRQFWWPLPVMYVAWNQYHGFENVIVAVAPGFRPRMVRFTPGATELKWMPITNDMTLSLRLEHE